MYVAILGVGLLLAAERVLAHHAFSVEFDANKKVTMKGTIAKMEWVNPHSWLWIDTKGPDGTVEQWGFEFGTPNALYRRGWTKSSLPIGAQVTVVAYLAMDGRKIASADEVTLPDGRTLFAGTSGNGAPNDRERR
jgi:hypothetical protein